MEQVDRAVAAGIPRLTVEHLARFTDRAEVPTYAREQLRRSIVHFGVGGFHRAHQAVYLDELAERRITSDWGLCGVGLLSQDRGMAEALWPQQQLFTVVERSATADRARIIGSMTHYLFAPENPQDVLAALTDPGTRIVSLTITEGGYNVNEATGEFDATTPAIQEDLRHPSTPSTVFGYICEALNRRRGAGVAPFTVLSCDNLQGNGAVVRKAILDFAALRDSSLLHWIEANVTFPNCMVDRITPQTADSDRELVATRFGIADAWPVVTEPFKQWIVEDSFCNGRPPLEEVGVQFTADVHPYEMMKIRLLNGSHVALGYLGHLAGYRYVHDVMGDPLFREYMTRIMDDEVTPLLPAVPGVDLESYKHTLVERFANPKIGDQVARICLDGSGKMPKFILASIGDALASGLPHRLLTLVVAGWFRYLLGVDEQGEPILIQDPMADVLQALAAEGREDPRPLLGVHRLFGDLAQNQMFVDELSSSLQEVYRYGARAALTRALQA